MKNQNILTFKRYGKQNQLQKVVMNLKELRTTNKHTKTLLISKGLKPYIPKLNKLKVGLCCFGVLGCLGTPATNFAIPFIIGWGLK